MPSTSSRIPALALAALLCASLAAPTLCLGATPMPDTPRTYTNPLGDIHMGDPFVLKHEGSYYLFGTAGRGGFACWTSPDLVDWAPAGLATHRTAETWGQTNFWAPEVRRYRGKFYMTYSAQRDRDAGFRLCLAVSDAPAGPYVDLHAPWLDIGWSTIDADLFVDADGAPYIFFTKVGTEPNPPGSERDRHLYGITYGARLSDDLSAMVGDPVLCVQADQPWEQVERTRVLCNEGPFVFRVPDVLNDGSAASENEGGPGRTPERSGRAAGRTHERAGRAGYYMTYSSGHYASPAYGIGYATAPSPLGPWAKSPDNPLVTTDVTAGVSGPGHNSITTSPDGKELWMVYHAHADAAHPSGNRTLNIDRLIVEDDGTLRLLGPTRTPQPMPSGAP